MPHMEAIPDTPRKRQTLKAWFLLFRPWSYTATLVPFLLGLAIALRGSPPESGASPWRWCLALASGIFFQAVVNLLNTWGDERSGVDAVPGAIRTTPQVHDGIVSMRALFTAAMACVVLAAAFGIPTAFLLDGDGSVRFNWPILVAAAIGFLGATNYSTLFKFKYRGFGVPFVSFLMGPLETFAAYAAFMPYRVMRMCSTVDGVLIVVLVFAIATLPVAALVGVIMHGNDMRDISTDRAAGIRTLATTFGPGGSLLYYWACHVLPYVFVAAIAIPMLFQSWRYLPLLLPFLALPVSARTLRASTAAYLAWRRSVCEGRPGTPPSPPWIRLERWSGLVHFVFGILYFAALILSDFSSVDI